jgi:hypothetical protein
MVSPNGCGQTTFRGNRPLLEFCRVLVRTAVCTQTAARRFEMTPLGQTFCDNTPDQLQRSWSLVGIVELIEV